VSRRKQNRYSTCKHRDYLAQKSETVPYFEKLANNSNKIVMTQFLATFGALYKSAFWQDQI